MVISKLLTALLAAPVLALPLDTTVDGVPDRRVNTPKPAGHDAMMSRIMQAVTSVNVTDIDSRAPGYAQLHADIMWGEDHIPLLSQNIPAASSQPGIQRRGGSKAQGSTTLTSDQAYQLMAWAEASTFAHCTKDALVAWSCNGCTTGRLPNTHTVTFFSDSWTGMQGYVAVNDDFKTIIISFRGSSNFQNWIQNLNFIKSDLELPGGSGVYVHSGFYNTWWAVRDQVVAAATAAMNAYPGYTVTFTGHSLGGAVAVMGAVDFAVNFKPSSRIVVRTMGQPRVGDPNLYPYMQSLGLTNYIHGVNYNDIVPHLAPIAFNFRHDISENWIDSNGRYVTCNDAQNNGEDTNCANTTPPWVSTAAHLTYFGIKMGGGEC